MVLIWDLIQLELNQTWWLEVSGDARCLIGWRTFESWLMDWTDDLSPVWRIEDSCWCLVERDSLCTYLSISVCPSVWWVCRSRLWLAAAAFFGRLAVGAEAASLRRRWLVLDSRLGSVQVQTSILDVLVNPLCCFQEGLFHVLSAEGKV